VSNGKPILLVGESGTAKSVTINNYLASLDGAVNLVLNMNFSSRTSSMDVQVQIGWPLLQLWCAFSLSLHCFCESVGNQVL
jgi:ABC-type dipeptide/oligopeptide/nickel transport system ATPase component